MWYWKNERRHDFQSVEEIKDELINNGIFIFIGKKTTKQISSFTDNDVDKIIECFDYLYELYRYVQSGRELVGRLCWNTNHWISPSGRKGKSSNKGSYEYKMGFGNEEWLFDKTKLIKGYHYGFLQPINHNRNKYIGNVFDIHLYTINSETKETWWLGMINNAWIVDAEESEKVYNEYKKRGFLKEMIHQLEVIEADVKELSLTTPQNFFNVKYKPNDLRLLDEPQKVSNKDKSISGKYYSSFNTYISTPQSITIEPKIFTLQGDSNPSDILKTTRYYSYGVSEVNLSHNIMVASSLKQLKKECDKAFANVSTTQGTFVDVVTEDKGKCIFYEFKISPTFKACIREALSQIMEYAYYPDRTIAHKLIIVSGNDINEDGKKYMKRLRTEFRIPVYYQKFNFDTERLESTLY